jgi:hypothetical protein
MRRAWHFGSVRKKKITCRCFVREPEAERLFGRPKRRRKYSVTSYMKKCNERERGSDFSKYFSVPMSVSFHHRSMLIY